MYSVNLSLILNDPVDFIPNLFHSLFAKTINLLVVMIRNINSPKKH